MDGLREHFRYEGFLDHEKREPLGVSCTNVFKLLGQEVLRSMETFSSRE